MARGARLSCVERGSSVSGRTSMNSQKLQLCTPEASTEPHCEQIVFTGAFCAADALTPVRRSIPSIPLSAKVNYRRIAEGVVRDSRVVRLRTGLAEGGLRG